jgi:hypothetical protein
MTFGRATSSARSIPGSNPNTQTINRNMPIILWIRSFFTRVKTNNLKYKNGRTRVDATMRMIPVAG